MLGVAIEIIGYVDDNQPGWVECRLTDVRGREWRFVEKVPIVTSDDLDAKSSYPQPGIIGCQLVERRQENGREVIVIDTELPWHVESTTGETQFEIWAEQLVEFDLAGPVTFDPVWRTPQVLALARTIYDERAFDRMPELADALKEAGCTDAWILAHCRKPLHVRRCPVLDMLLGKG